MTHKRMEQTQQNENRKKGGLLWVLIGILLVSNGVTIYLWLTEKNKAAEQIVVTEKVVVSVTT